MGLCNIMTLTPRRGVVAFRPRWRLLAAAVLGAFLVLSGSAAWAADPTPTVSTSMPVYEPLAHVVDGDVSTRFVSAGDPQAGDFIRLDYGAALTVTKIAVTLDPGPPAPPTQLQWSNDGQTWTTLDSYSAKTYAWTGSIEARYLRLFLPERVYNWLAVHEIDVTAAATEPDPEPEPEPDPTPTTPPTVPGTALSCTSESPCVVTVDPNAPVFEAASIGVALCLLLLSALVGSSLRRP
jgi:hypothetical protein